VFQIVKKETAKLRGPYTICVKISTGIR